jgi:hypothetical protein
MDITPHFRPEPETMNPFTADDQRLKELILHIAARCGDWEAFDVSLLDRILFQADFLHFRLYGYPITGQTYVRGIRAPSPENRRGTTRLLVQAGDMEIQERPLGDGLHVRTVPVALREPDLRGFDGQEIAIAERVLRFYRETWISGRNQAPDRNGAPGWETPWVLGQEGPDLVDLPWELAGPGEEIPYYLALVSAAPAIAIPGPDPIPSQTRQPLRLLERTP